ncbi:hypothetical protein [Halobaculum sp. MBLA0143]|uniref:hypothetical protein n=1 Tax=Halobaculum sp. MBLA0143 TaxID=3079933 RepID=UPI003524A168
MTDDDLSEHLDPELDGAIAGTDTDDTLPGPVTIPRLVVALHVGGAAGLLPFALEAAQNGETGRLVTMAVVAGGLVAAGVVIARATARR